LRPRSDGETDAGGGGVLLQIRHIQRRPDLDAQATIHHIIRHADDGEPGRTACTQDAAYSVAESARARPVALRERTTDDCGKRSTQSISRVERSPFDHPDTQRVEVAGRDMSNVHLRRLTDIGPLPFDD